MTQILDEVSEFLTELVSDLTGLHVQASAILTNPGDRDNVDAVAGAPAGIIDRAQALAARIADERESEDEESSASDAPKPAAKAKASTPRQSRKK